jgi:hypothetical protein
MLMGLGCGRPRRRGRGLARCRGLRGRGKRFGSRFAFMRRLRFFESWTGRRARCRILLRCSGGRVGQRVLVDCDYIFVRQDV